MSTIFSARFWAAAAERAAKTAAGSALTLLTTNATGLLDVDWAQAGSVVGLSVVASLLMSITSAGIGNSGPSLTTETIETPLGRHEAQE